MVSEQATYRHDLGKGSFLDAFPIDPKIERNDLEAFMRSRDQNIKPDLETIAKNVCFAASIDSLDDFEVNISEREYQVPQQLQAYREAVGKASDAKGRYNGPVAIVDGAVNIPLKVFKGGYYDFIATKLGAVPHDLVPSQYPASKTIDELFREWNIDPDQRARYLGFAYLMLTNNGKEVSFVQRAKGMAIAPDCIATPGSTPNPDLSKKDFDFKAYCREHINGELNEEYKLDAKEFEIGKLYLFDDKKEVPFTAIEIRTPLTTRDLAKRIHGNEQAIKEHPIICAISPESVQTMIERFPLFPSFVQILRVFSQHR